MNKWINVIDKYVAERVNIWTFLHSEVIWVRVGAASTASRGTCHTKPEASKAFFDVVTKVWIIYSKSERGWISQHKCFLKVMICGNFVFVPFFFSSSSFLFLFSWIFLNFLCPEFLNSHFLKTFFWFFFRNGWQKWAGLNFQWKSNGNTRKSRETFGGKSPYFNSLSHILKEWNGAGAHCTDFQLNKPTEVKPLQTQATLTLVNILFIVDRPLKTRRVSLLNNGLRVARHHQGTTPGSFNPVASISAIRMSNRAMFTTPLYRPQTPYGLSRSKYMPAGSDVRCFACRTTGRLAGPAGLQAIGVRPRLRRVSGMTQSGSATRAGCCPLAISTLRGCAGGEDIVPLTVCRPTSRWLGSNPDRFR